MFLTLIAQVAAPPLPAYALKRVDEIDAGAAVAAGIFPTVVYVLVTVLSGVSRIAYASVAVASTPSGAGGALASAPEAIVADAELRIVRS